MKSAQGPASAPARLHGLIGLAALLAAACPPVAARPAHAASEELDALASTLAAAKDPERASAAVRTLVEKPPPAGPVAGAELLWRLAEKKALDDQLAALAAGLLAHEDPFVRGLAEWAIATRVEMDNKGQEVLWPREDPPAWFRRWMEYTSGKARASNLLDADYVRFAVLWGIHDDGRKLLDSAAAVQRRAQGAAREALQSASPDTRTMIARQLDRIESARRGLAAAVEQSPGDLAAHRRLWLEARRAARPVALANPAVDFNRLLFVKLHAAHTHRNITGSQYPWVHKPGGSICVQEGLEPDSPVRDVLGGQLGPGHVHGIDLWWDADRVVLGYARQPRWPPPWDTMAGDHVFELRRDQTPTRLYEVRLDGSGLRQLTGDPTWNDFEPAYCADGSIVFASDRSGRSSECGKFTADHTVINLYAIGPDWQDEGGTEKEKGPGAFPTPRRLSDNKDIDRYPHVLDNGLVIYTRWEYQERHFLEVHSLWTARPDGTMNDALFKQHLTAPWGLRDARSIPGLHKLVAVATGHHTFAYGPLVLIDPRAGMNSAEAMRVVTPHLKPEEGPMAGSPVEQGGVPDRGGLCHTPWALSETCFLVSFSYGRPASGTQGGTNASGFAVYLMDAYGNKELLHRDPILSCVYPMPVKARPRPPLVGRASSLPEDGREGRASAACFVADANLGLDGVPRGTVKYLRVAQRVGWPLDEKIGAMRYIPGNAWEKRFGYWEWAPVRVLGDVPVEEDGSAHFLVPADTAVYFQALDGDRMELRRMRSHVTFQQGEVRACIGCHETRALAPGTAPGTAAPALALQRPPRVPEPPPWGAEKLLGYEWLVQPVLDRHCVRCHGPDKAEGGLDLGAAREEDGFLRSFRAIFGLRPGTDKALAPLVSVSNRFDGGQVTRTKEFGSHRSRLVTVLREDDLHKREVRLDRDEWLALVAWIDANAPYHDTFFNKRPPGGGPPRRDVRIELPAPPAGYQEKAK